MDEGFELPVHYKGLEQHLPARLVQFGYTYRIEVDIENTIISFERDEEKNWRVLINPESEPAKINIDLINAVIETLENI